MILITDKFLRLEIQVPRFRSATTLALICLILLREGRGTITRQITRQ